ncbi:MAG TPA: metalloregulator ArsR/SmtB family transcription factor [Streptosporangiaceae bacterium]|nr:metalloregulator ArsR/SmtB family transcription factor [Streptosporangiaceae bacterium]
MIHPPEPAESPRLPEAQQPRGLAELDALDAIFGALAHQARRTILAVLHARGGEMTSGAIAARFEHSWPTTSQHLNVLARAGLVTISMRGRERVYRLDAGRLHAVASDWLDRFDRRT